MTRLMLQFIHNWNHFHLIPFYIQHQIHWRYLAIDYATISQTEFFYGIAWDLWSDDFDEGIFNGSYSAASFRAT